MAHPDLDKLLNTLLEIAQTFLAKRGGFLPFGAWLHQSGQLTLVHAQTEGEQTGSQPLVDLLVRGLREHVRKNDLAASGICLDVWVSEPGDSRKSDAICVRLEHQNGEAVDVYLPYRKRLLRQHSYGDLFVLESARAVFTRESFDPKPSQPMRQPD